MDRFYRLPEWERTWHEDRARRAEERCRECDLPVSVCSDPEKRWYPQRVVCYPTMEAAAAQARYARLHEKAQWHNGEFEDWSPQPSDDTPYRFDMGVRITVGDRNVNPDDDFLRTTDHPDDEDDDESGE